MTNLAQDFNSIKSLCVFINFGPTIIQVTWGMSPNLPRGIIVVTRTFDIDKKWPSAKPARNESIVINIVIMSAVKTSIAGHTPPPVASERRLIRSSVYLIGRYLTLCFPIRCLHSRTFQHQRFSVLCSLRSAR